MTDKELRRLRRDELLEILLGQQKEIDRLTAALAEAEKKLEDREIKIMNAGSIAEASLALTEVFAQAQRAADLYIENIRRRTGAAEEPAAETAAEETPAGEIQATAEAAAVTEEAVAETAVETALETADAEVREAETAVENEQTEGEKAQDKTADAPEGGETAV